MKDIKIHIFLFVITSLECPMSWDIIFMIQVVKDWEDNSIKILRLAQTSYVPKSAIKLLTITYYTSNEMLTLHFIKLQSDPFVVWESRCLCEGFITPKNFYDEIVVKIRLSFIPLEQWKGHKCTPLDDLSIANDRTLAIKWLHYWI